MSIESDFDVPFVAALALREKQIQQNYRPIIAVHKWFARRPGTLFRGLALAEFGSEPLQNAFYRANSFPGKVVADPFMGGGIPLLEANRVGCDVIGFDINPMAAWIVREEIEHLDLDAYKSAAVLLTKRLEVEVGNLYRTCCTKCGANDVPVKYFLWIKTHDCTSCGHRFDLFQGYLLAEDRRHPRNVLVCAACGDLNEVVDLKRPGPCAGCGNTLRTQGQAKRNRCECPKCRHVNGYPNGRAGPPKHRLFALEYHCPYCKTGHVGRFFKKPDAHDQKKFARAEARWTEIAPQYAPSDPIPPGDETDRLHRWGYKNYRDLFNSRQLLGLELSARLIAEVESERVRSALATNLSDLLRYQNMLCRYDTMALKSLDIFSIHGFPVSHIQCESNLLGISNGNGINVGSGGWSNIIDKYAKAKRYCDKPFEVQIQGTRKVVTPIEGEWIGERLNGNGAKPPRQVSILCKNATQIQLPDASLDAVFTDPPYFGNVQYGELMDFCYVWLRRLVGMKPEGFDRSSTRDPGELTGNTTLDRGIGHFADGLAAVFRRMAKALKPGAPLAFTYHHNRQEAYAAVGVAILDAGLTCSATLPCPAEMGGSIHIFGTGSSIVDTIFVCRTTGITKLRWLFKDANELAGIVGSDLANLRSAGLKPTSGDLRCIVYGHLSRMAIWTLRREWQPNRPILDRINGFSTTMDRIARFRDVAEIVERKRTLPPLRIGLSDIRGEYETDAVAF